MIDTICSAVITGQLKRIEPLVQSALDDGIPANDILNAMTAAMDEVGDRFQRNAIFVPEMLLSAKTMQRGVGILRPTLKRTEQATLGKCIIGTVRGDLHDIGKNVVAMMLETVGFEIVDLGVDVPAERFVEAIRQHPDCRVVGVSALLTTTLKAMAETVEAIRASVFSGNVKILIGGAPVTQDFAQRIGADAYTPNAAAAAECAKRLVSAGNAAPHDSERGDAPKTVL